MAEEKYSDLIMDDLTFYGVKLRHPKDWYPELLHGAKDHVPVRTYSARWAKIEENKKGEIEATLTFPVSKETVEKYQKDIQGGIKFRVLIPKEGLKVLPDKTMNENIKAYNRRIGFEKLQEFHGCRAYPQSFNIDINTCTAIIKMFLV